MNKLKNYLLLSLILCAGTLFSEEQGIHQMPQAGEVAVNEASFQLDQAAVRGVAQDFEKLVQEALGAQAPSLAERIGVFACRELIKFGPIIFLLFVFPFFTRRNFKTGQYYDSKYLSAENSKRIAYYAYVLQYFTPIFADFFIRIKKNNLVKSIEKIVQYVDSLNAEQKNEIVQICKEKYAKLLKAKVAKKTLGHWGTGFDLALDCIFWVCVIPSLIDAPFELYHKKIGFNDCMLGLALLSIAIFDSFVNLNAFFTIFDAGDKKVPILTSEEDGFVLEKLNGALAQVKPEKASFYIN